MEFCHKERISLKSGKWKYLSHNTVIDLTRLQSKAEDKNVTFQQPKDDDKNPTIVLEGDSDAVRQISEELQRLIAAICTNSSPIVVSRPGTVRYFVSEVGQTIISGIEKIERCCIQLIVETQNNIVEASKAAGVMSTVKSKKKCKLTTESNSSAMTGDQPPALVFTAGKLVIEILCGDITEDATDAVVNPTNEQMRLGGGVGKALLKKAGKELENSLDREISRGFKLEEGKVFMTKASGTLRCKYIYHVVSPDRKLSSLSKIVTACLKKADEQTLSSMSFLPLVLHQLHINLLRLLSIFVKPSSNMATVILITCNRCVS